MPGILVLLADGFEEMEAVTPVDIFRRAEIKTVTAGLHGGTIESSRKIRIAPDTTIDEVRASDFDMIYLPGGQPGTTHLKNDARVLKLLNEFQSAGKMIGAICAAPGVLAAAKLIGGKKVTSHPSVREELAGAVYLEDAVVTDGNVVTSRGAGTAADMAFSVVAKLVSKDTADKIRKAMQFRD